MGVYDHLMAGEEMLSQFDPFYATSRRVIRYVQKPTREEFLELPYARLTSIETIKTPRHNLMIAGTAVIIGAVFLFLTLFVVITLLPAIIMGLAMIIYGGMGKEGYVQLHIHGATSGEERPWRVKWQGSGSFIATIRSVIGQMPDF